VWAERLLADLPYPVLAARETPRPGALDKNERVIEDAGCDGIWPLEWSKYVLRCQASLHQALANWCGESAKRGFPSFAIDASHEVSRVYRNDALGLSLQGHNNNVLPVEVVLP
jgi:hypothetical protein